MRQESEIKLEQAELFYKFCIGTRALIDIAQDKVLEYGPFTFYDDRVEAEEMELSREEELIAASILEHVGTYMMILQLNKVLEDEWGEGRLQNDKDMEKQAISQVVRLIRNAFAHDPFKPTWDISIASRCKLYEIPGILTLKTGCLHGKRIERRDYGGPLALLRLLQYARKKLSQR